MRAHFGVWIFSGISVFGGAVALGQTYPNKPIRIVTADAGGGLDFAARLIAQGISASLEQQVIVENRAIVVMATTVSKAPPDGYTLLFAGTTFMIAPLLERTAYDPLRDFSPISLVTRQPNIFVVPPTLPVKSVKELIALAKARPGELNYASSGIGSQAHLATELFKSMTGVNIVHIPYKGVGPALSDLIRGQVQLMSATPASVTPHVKSGRLRALAVTSAAPSPLAPGLPTVAGPTLPDYESITIQGLFAPAKTSEAVVHRLNQEIVRVLNRPEVKQQFFNTGVEAVGSSPEQLTAIMKTGMERMGKLIKDIGLRAE